VRFPRPAGEIFPPVGLDNPSPPISLKIICDATARKIKAVSNKEGRKDGEHYLLRNRRRVRASSLQSFVRAARLRIEMQYLQPLPLKSTKRERMNMDSVKSDLTRCTAEIGDEFEARLGIEIVEVWYAGRKVEALARLRDRGKQCVEYRHII
jgi:hypothetical protein